MEGRTNKYSQVSPERAKVWTEKSPKYHYNHHYIRQQNTGKVPVVYYLCRNRQLEHPHFMEVPLSSPDGLYLRDVIERLNVLRGRGMTSMYSWSCKRSYKNGFVWHDLCEDDLILPAHGNEHVLKGSELFEEYNSGRFSPIMVQNPKTLPEPPSSRSQDESSSPSSLNGRSMKNSQDDELSPPVHCPGSSAVSPESIIGKKSCWNGPLNLTQYKVNKSDGLTDASTQTEESSSRGVRTQDTCTRGVSTEDGSLEPESGKTSENKVPRIKETSDICSDLVSPPPSTSSAPSSSGRIDTLESLIRSDARKFNSFRILEEEEFRIPSGMKFKPSNMLMQLISCGSISVKDLSFGLIPTYKPKFSYSKFASPLFSTSSMLGEHDYLVENPRLMRMKLEDKEYFSASLVETNMAEEGVAALKRSSSYNADRITKEIDSVEEKEEASSTRLKCIPRSIKATLSKQPKCESMRSPNFEWPRILSDRVENSRIIAPDTPDCRSKRTTEPLLGKKQSRKQDTARDNNEFVIKIEERLASGARVIIQSKAASNSEQSS